MAFLQLTLHLGRADPTPFEDALFAAGASSVTLQDSADDPILEPAPGATPLWPTVTLKAIFPHDAGEARILATLRQLTHADLPHEFERIEDRVWEREWLKDFQPMRFGERLWICPGGKLPFWPEPSAHGPAPCLIHLDPGLAFGTGTHPTTALCLEWLDGTNVDNKSVIDYGCGSGILAIAALALGARSAIGIDIDPQALLASRANAERNGVSERLRLQDAAKLPAPADVVLANILAGPLDELAPTLASLVIADGDLVLSGILEGQAAHLIERYTPWFAMDKPVVRDDWARLTGKRL